MSRKLPGLSAIAALTVAGLLMGACGAKDPKFSAGTVPDAASARDAMIMIDTNGDMTVLNTPQLCADPRFGRPAERRRSGSVTIPCWDGS